MMCAEDSNDNIVTLGVDFLSDIIVYQNKDTVLI